MASRDEEHGRQPSVRSADADDAAAGLMRLYHLFHTGDSPSVGRGAGSAPKQLPELYDMAAEVNTGSSPRGELEPGPLSNLAETDKSTEKWLMHYHESQGSPKVSLEQAVCGKKGIPPPPRTSARVTRSSGPPEIGNLFGLKDLPKTPYVREELKPKPVWSMEGPMTGCSSFVMSQAKIILDIANMQTPDRSDAEAGVAAGAAATANSAQGNSYADQRSSGMESSIFAGAGGGAGEDRDAQGYIGAGGWGKKRQRQEEEPGHAGGDVVDGSFPGARADGAESIAAAGDRAGSRHESGLWAGAGAGTRAGVCDGAEGEFNRQLKRARVSGGASGSGSVEGATDGSDGTDSRASFSDTEGASCPGAAACGKMSTEKIWRDVDEVDGAVGGPGGDGSGGVRVAAKSSSGWHAQDSVS